MDNSLSHPCSCILVYLIYSILIVYCHGERITQIFLKNYHNYFNFL